MHVLLTGVTGFLARRIAHDLLVAGHHIRGSLRDVARADDVRAVMPPEALDRLSFVELTLDSDDGWTDAASGMDAIIHTASPFPLEQTPADPQTVIRPAVEGTLRAMEAAKANGVDRVILTSSTVAVVNGPRPAGRLRDERDWSTADHRNANAYVRSKTEAEQAAWAFADENAINLTVLNPGLILGPPLGEERSTSLKVVTRILSGSDPMVPPISFETVDVRDVSRAHVIALETPGLAGERILLAAGTLWFADIAKIARQEAPDRKLPTRTAPRLMIKALAMFDPALKGIVPILGRNEPVSNAKAVKMLGLDFIPAEDAARAAVKALL
ncbi:MAG: NAD-dependent epimerase/dehydratase family protein [Pseudomonadota bacterium]